MKITDGDLVFLTIKGRLNDDLLSNIRGSFNKWAQSRGLGNCTLVLLSGEGLEVDINSMSVNDVFENTVLNGQTKD